MLTETTVQILTRDFAHVFDVRVRSSKNTHGVPFGIGWYEYYADRNTGEKYKVHCSDGVYSGKSAHTNDDLRWLEQCYNAIIARTHNETKAGQTTIYISRNEGAIMNNFTHAKWLESEVGKLDGKQSNIYLLEGGFVGMCRGIPVVCDLKREDALPPRMEASPTPQKIEETL